MTVCGIMYAWIGREPVKVTNRHLEIGPYL